MRLFYLIVSTSTRYHYTCRFNSVVEPREDVRCLLESYIFSGGLRSFPLLARLTCRDELPANSNDDFLRKVFENDLNEYGVIHTWLDKSHPEPAWKRKRTPINAMIELKYFTVLVYLCGFGHELLDCTRHLMRGRLWRR